MSAPEGNYGKPEVVALEGGHGILLLNRVLRTPAGHEFVVPSGSLARAAAAEWAGQSGALRSQTMPLTSLAATAIDWIGQKRAAVIEQLIARAAFDLLCYRVDAPADLLELQDRYWQPLLDWATDQWGVKLRVTRGVMPVEQPRHVLEVLRTVIHGDNDMELTALASIVQVSGSLILGLALARGRIDADAAFIAAQLEESYQIERWGELDETRRRRHDLRSELDQAARFISALRAG